MLHEARALHWGRNVDSQHYAERSTFVNNLKRYSSSRRVYLCLVAWTETSSMPLPKSDKYAQ